MYQWFVTVDTDKSGQITAMELQQALTNGNWSHFNPETCRLMIGECCTMLSLVLQSKCTVLQIVTVGRLDSFQD